MCLFVWLSNSLFVRSYFLVHPIFSWTKGLDKTEQDFKVGITDEDLTNKKRITSSRVKETWYQGQDWLDPFLVIFCIK